MNKIQVIKRNGKKVDLDLSKFHNVVQYACDGITNVSTSVVELNSQIQFYDGMKTSDIQEILIKSAADLIEEDTPNYQYVAGKLINYHLRKEVYEQFIPLSLYEIVKKNINLKLYTSELLEWFTKEDFDTLDRIIDHNRDEIIPYAGMEQWRGKYLVKDRTNGKILETPQIAYILIAAVIFRNYPNRIKWIKDYYDAISKFYISLPTPILAGLRTTLKQVSSCVLVDIDDTLNSITAGTSAIVKYVSQRAGLGVNMGRIRSIGSSVKNGLAVHTGKTPYVRLIQSAVQSASQGGIRKASATICFVGWDLEIEDLFVLKNNKGTDDNRVKHLDYAIQLNKLFYDRLINNESITLFSTSEVPGLYEAFISDYEKFKKLYIEYENNPNIRKKYINAVDFFTILIQERTDTGRIYIMNIDSANEHGPYYPELAPISMTNLCVEILQTTVPLQDINDEDGRISLCTLSAINIGILNNKYDLEKYCNLAIRALNEIIDYQEYPIIAAKKGIDDYRAIGIGITNLAYWMAKNDLSYENIDQEGLDLIDEWFEAFSYYNIKTSSDIAKERGTPCGKIETLKYKDGIIPFDTRKLGVDELVKPKLRMDWRFLREQLKEFGVMNSPIMSQFPAETGSQTSHSTNGIEPVLSLITSKKSKEGTLKQVVPAIYKYKNKYNLKWDQKSPNGYLKIMCVIQKWIDGGMSTNTFYNPIFYENKEIPMSLIIKDIIDYYKWGGKNLYYMSVNDNSGEEKEILIENIENNKNEDIDVCEACSL